MLVAIHNDRYGKFDPFCERYEKILAYNNIESIRVDASDIDFWEKVKSADYFIYRWIQWDDHIQIAKNIMPIIENELKVKCFPNLKTTWHYDDKIKQYYLLKQHGYPVIDSWVFYDKKKALDWLDDVKEYPIVFKLKSGAGSSNVLLAKSKGAAVKFINKLFGSGVVNVNFSGNTKSADFNIKKFVRHVGGNFARRLRGEDAVPYWQINKNYVFFQRFLPGNKFDTRIVVIGGRAIPFMRLVRKNDFRASGSGMINFDHTIIDMRCVEISFKVSKELEFQAMAYDFLHDKEGNPWIIEISYTTIDTVVYRCEGYWDEDLTWHNGHNWMQHLDLIDLMNDPTLKVPDDLI